MDESFLSDYYNHFSRLAHILSHLDVTGQFSAGTKALFPNYHAALESFEVRKLAGEGSQSLTRNKFDLEKCRETNQRVAKRIT